MSALTTPQHFLGQPQYRVDPDVSNPLGARIIGGCIPGVCSLRGNAASIVKSCGQFGLGTAGGSGNYATAGPARVLIGRASGASADSRDVTFVFVGYVSNNNAIWFYDGQSDGVSSWWFKTDASGNLSASYGQSTNLAGTVPIPNGPVVLICHGGTNGGQVARTWVNGVEYAGTAATDSWTNSPAFTGMFGSSAYPTTNTFAGTGNLALVLRGNVTSAEAKRITDNPWALFRAPDISRMFFGVSFGATTHTTTGALTGPGSSIVGVAKHPHTTSGVLIGPGSTIAGTSVHKTKHTTSGVLTGPGSTIAGTSTRFRAHSTTGTLTGAGAAVVGSATRAPHAGTHTTSGVLTGQGSTVSGTSVHKTKHVTSGAIVGPGSSIVGSAKHPHITSGVLSGGSAIVVGTAHRGAITTHTTSGTLTGQGAAVSSESSQQTLTHADLVAISNAVWNRLTDTTYTSGDLLRLIAAMAAGRVSGAQTGTEIFRDVGDTKARITATVDDKGNRTSINLDPT